MTNTALAERAVVGDAAPAFTGTDADGKPHNLAAYRGKTVVLEWTNHDCPFVGKHYDSGNMQKLQRRAVKDGVVWLSIVSSAPGTQGHVSPDEAKEISASDKAAHTAKILDPSGKIGRLYGATTTPHMYIIKPNGKLAYAGAIDSEPGWDESEIAGATNYVTMALKAVKAGKAPNPSSTRPYGCSVKYD
ncbi:MAG: thioredoxin family protein [Rhodospirillaceae bacterium]|nr:thioredoxin family protein [Rhodospirillaceae bacterium]